MQDSGAPLSAVCAPDLYMLVRHGANNWRTLAGNTDVDTYFRSLPPSARSICDAVEEEDVAFYSRLGRS